MGRFYLKVGTKRAEKTLTGYIRKKEYDEVEESPEREEEEEGGEVLEVAIQKYIKSNSKAL